MVDILKNTLQIGKVYSLKKFLNDYFERKCYAATLLLCHTATNVYRTTVNLEGMSSSTTFLRIPISQMNLFKLFLYQNSFEITNYSIGGSFLLIRTIFLRKPDVFAGKIKENVGFLSFSWELTRKSVFSNIPSVSKF